MRRNAKMKVKNTKPLNDKLIVYTIIGIVALIIVLVGLLLYSKSLSDSVKEGTMSLEQMANLTSENTKNEANTESASTDFGKTVEEAENEIKEEANTNNTSNTQTTASTNETKKSTNTSVTNNANATIDANNKTNSSKNTESKSKSDTKKELTFAKPVDGEIMREYAKDNLVYSETLKEWVTHLGIDIKAEKTSVVKSAEAGTVKSIKNDPRYGLTIVVDHGDGYQTVYSNLLTSEFVVEGEKVEKGQSLGTVGNTAVFEIADEAHLHFEILKDSIQIDPSIYLK